MLNIDLGTPMKNICSKTVAYSFMVHFVRKEKHTVCLGKPSQVSISAKELKTGVYVYGILLNGGLVKSKKMMVIK